MNVKPGTWDLASQCEKRAEARSKCQRNERVGEGNGAVEELANVSAVDGFWRSSTGQVSLKKTLKMTARKWAIKEEVLCKNILEKGKCTDWGYGYAEWGIVQKSSNSFLGSKKENSSHTGQISFVIRNLSIPGIPILQDIGTVSPMSLLQTELYSFYFLVLFAS